jgi:hypothetical protein
VIIDAGGGTVDATTYTVTNEDPLKLKREAVEPGGIVKYQLARSLTLTCSRRPIWLKLPQ